MNVILKIFLITIAASCVIILPSCTRGGGDSLASADSADSEPIVTTVRSESGTVSTSVTTSEEVTPSVDATGGEAVTTETYLSLDEETFCFEEQTYPESEVSSEQSITESEASEISFESTSISGTATGFSTVDRVAPTTVTTVSPDPHTAILPTETTVLVEMRFFRKVGD